MLTKPYSDTVKARVARDPAFAQALLDERDTEINQLRTALSAMLGLVGELTGDRTSGMEPVKLAHEALWG